MAVADVRAFDEETGGGSGLLKLLGEATAVIDSMWRSALSDGTGQAALHLGEASQGLHRAMIALGSLHRLPGD